MLLRKLKKCFQTVCNYTSRCESKGVLEIAELSRSLGRGDITILGFGYKTSAPYAALANGTIEHALDYDDTHSKAILHPTVVVAPAALAIAEEKGFIW